MRFELAESVLVHPYTTQNCREDGDKTQDMIRVQVRDEDASDICEFQRGLVQPRQSAICSIEYCQSESELARNHISSHQMSLPKSTAKEEQFRLMIGPPPVIQRCTRVR